MVLRMFAQLLFPASKEADRVYAEVVRHQAAVVQNFNDPENKREALNTLVENMLKEIAKDA